MCVGGWGAGGGLLYEEERSEHTEDPGKPDPDQTPNTDDEKEE